MKTNNYPDAVMIERINQIKTEKNLTDAQIGKKLEVGKQQVYKWRSGLAIPNSVYIRRFALQFDVSADWLFGLSDRKERK